MSEETRVLHFVGPFSMISDNPRFLLDDEVAEEPGIYLWTVKGSNGYIIDYVGETGKTIRERFVQHLQDQFVGRYNIFDPDRMRQGDRHYVWRGYLWRKAAHEQGVKDFFRNTERHLSEILRMFREYRVFVAPLFTDARMRKRIETGILNEMSELEFYSRSLQARPQNRVSLKTTETPETYKIIVKEKIVGLGHTITV